MKVERLPVDGDWEAVAEAVEKQLRELGLTYNDLAERCGIHNSTIRMLQYPEARYRSTLVAITAGLELRYDALINVLLGKDA